MTRIKLIFQLIALTACTLVSKESKAQTYTTTINWQSKIGGSLEDHPYFISKTSDGGFIIAANSNSPISGDKTENSMGGYDFWIIKLDANGTIEWQNTIGGAGQEFAYAVHQTPDGGYLIGGQSDSGISGDKTENSFGDSDYWVVKLNSSGVVQWDKTVGGSDLDEVFSFQLTSDGGCIIGGNSYSNISGNKTENCIGEADYWIVKLDGSGNLVWQNTIGSLNYDGFTYIVESLDNGFCVAGYSYGNISGDKTENSNGGVDLWILKLNSSGSIVWQNTIGGSASDDIYAIERTADGGCILAANSSSDISGDKTENNIGLGDLWVIKLDVNGTIQWQNTIGGTAGDAASMIRQTADEEYIIGGYSVSNISGDKTENGYGSFDSWLVKLDGFGNVLWDKTLGGTGFDFAYALLEVTDGEYLISNVSNSAISGNVSQNSNGQNDLWLVNLQECELANLNSVDLSSSDICAGSSATLTITGDLNDASYWYLHSGGCFGILVDSTASTSFSVSPADTTEYFVSGLGGCATLVDTCMSLVLNVNSIPSTPTISAADSTTFCTGGSVTISSSLANSYLWSTGASGNSIIVSNSATIFVQTLSNEGCLSDTSNVIVVSETDCSGLTENESTILIYPNPGSDFMTIQTTEQIISIEVTDLTGKTVLAPFSGNSIDISRLNSGVYNLRIKTTNGAIEYHPVKIQVL